MAFEAPRELTDPRAMRAMAHPVRLALMEALNDAGTLTATEAAERVGESPSNCSFHLRQLAKWGLVEEAGGGRGRERPWRATALFTHWSGVDADADTAAAGDLLMSVIVDRYVEQIHSWIDRRSSEPAEWQAAAPFGDVVLHLTADELAQVSKELWAISMRYADRLADPSQRPDGSRPVTMLHLAFPSDPQGPSGES